MIDPMDTTSQTLLKDKEPAGQNQNKQRGIINPKRVLAALLLLTCVVGGVFLVAQNIRSSSPLASNTGGSSSLPRPWCAAPAALSTNFSGTSLSGLAENDVWSAGAQIMYWDGKKWSVVFGAPSPQDIFRSIVEIAPNNVWAVGERLTSGLPSHPLIVHWSGMGWQIVKSPDAAPGGKNALVSVSGSSPDDVWAAGFVVPARGPAGPLLEHWNGAKWSIVTHLDIPGNTQFTSIKAFSKGDVWAVGYQSVVFSSGKAMNQPVTAHWDGKQWRAMPNPDLRNLGGGSLYNIGGSSASDLWAVGSINNQMLTEHWDGKRWSMITSPSVPPNSSNWLSSVAASAPDNVWAVGRVGNNSGGFQPFIEHWDGHQWQSVQDPTQDAAELDIITTVGQQFWIAGLPRTSSSERAFIETLCP